jgi:organic radical activating enzyme
MTAEVNWALNSYCNFNCEYCRPEWRNGSLEFTLDDYLTVIEKLHLTRYQHHDMIDWRLDGGEPLHFPYLKELLQKIKERPSRVTLNTSGGDTYFPLFGVLSYLDQVRLSYHEWQNDEVVGFILEKCQEQNVRVKLIFPLLPGKIYETRDKIAEYTQQGFNCEEQVLRNIEGQLHNSYSLVDENRIMGRPDNWEIEDVTVPVGQPDPNYISLAVVNDHDPVYTGMPCWAGVDWLFINPKGFVSYSECGGRTEPINAFDPEWMPPNTSFACGVNQCRSKNDRTKIRVGGKA